MAIQGLRGTDSFVTDERPLNWRQGILMRFPNGHAPITALTSAMKKKVTDDPEFNWWEREVSNVRIELAADAGTGTSLTVTADPFGFGGGEQVKTGDLLYAEETGEIMLATADGTSTGLTVQRSWGAVAATTILVASENPNLVIIGSAYEEGADTPNNVRYTPTKVNNYTQIFRNSLKATRTAMQTRLRTVEEVRDAKTQALLYHSIGMEYGFIFGEKVEDLSGSQPKRTTGGIISFIPAGNINDVAGAAQGWDDIENIFLEAFRFGSQEKMAFCGNRAILTLQRAIRKADAASVELTPMTKEFGMDVRRLFTPYGTLVLKSHPLFNQIQSTIGTYLSFDSWMLIVDMADLTYRPLRNSDTQYLPDRQGNGIDGLTSEYLTEAGLEVNHGKHHYLVKGLTVAGAEA
ncbi:MAG: SU10 major capsid protein [bacterium]